MIMLIMIIIIMTTKEKKTLLTPYNIHRIIRYLLF